MCGISAIIGPEATTFNLSGMIGAMTHRGPDNTGNYIDEGKVAMGHNRLSIIDIGVDANQPMEDVSGRYVLCFNGEIYNYLELKEELKRNYSFKSNSDSEVLLAAYLMYGKDCLNKLNGMFSFIIWDKHEKAFFAARDRFGVKPLYYSIYQGNIFFASEIKALKKFGFLSKPNLITWSNYLMKGTYGAPETTFYDNIYQLKPGHYYIGNHLKSEITQWYNFKEEVRKQEELVPTYAFSEIKERFYNFVHNSLLLRFRADVPVGINISGGVDSSFLLAMVNQFTEKAKINALTFYCNDERYDEVQWVRKMLSKYRNPLSLCLLKSKEVPELAKEISCKMDEPFGGIPTLAYSKVFANARQKGIKVLLDGQGMDEQLGGYDYYTQNNGEIIQGLKNNSPFRANVLNKSLIAEYSKPKWDEPFDNDLQNLQYRDLFFTKIPRALRFNDRISMAHSTELREPFLDYRLVEFSFSLSKDYKIKGNIQKFLLREVLKDLVPEPISEAPKRPLQTPQREWLGNELYYWARETIYAMKDTSYGDWFNFEEIEKELVAYKNGNKETSFYIWQWINTALLAQNNTT